MSPSLVTNTTGCAVFGLYAEQLEQHRQATAAAAASRESSGSLGASSSDFSSRDSSPAAPCFFVCVAFCGSFTSFSTMMEEAIAVEFLPAPSAVSFFNGVYLVTSVILFSTMAMHAGGMCHCLLSASANPRAFRITTIVLVLTPLAVAAALAATVGAGSDLALTRIAAVLFAPLGAGLRFSLSLLLNERFAAAKPDRQKFVKYAGTLAANVLGTFVVLTVAGHRNARGPSVPLDALSEGFAGSLSTVSTFVRELDSSVVRPDGSRLPRLATHRSSFAYFSVAVLLSFGVGVGGFYLGKI